MNTDRLLYTQEPNGFAARIGVKPEDSQLVANLKILLFLWPQRERHMLEVERQMVAIQCLIHAHPQEGSIPALKEASSALNLMLTYFGMDEDAESAGVFKTARHAYEETVRALTKGTT